MITSRARTFAGLAAIALVGFATPAHADDAYVDLGTFRTGDTVTLEYDCTAAANAVGNIFDDSMTLIDEGGVETANPSISNPADQLFSEYGNGRFYVQIICRDAQFQQLSSFLYTFVLDVCGDEPTTTASATTAPITTLLDVGPRRQPHGQPPQCGSDAGSGLPGTGSASTSLVVIAVLSFATGAALMVARRRTIA